jgi:hypothetical protein
LIAGAIATPSVLAGWLLAPYVLFRLTGKLAGGWVASRIARGTAPGHLGALLVAPGVLGVAFALNMEQVLPASGGTFVFAVAAGAIASELIAVFVTPSTARS